MADDAVAPNVDITVGGTEVDDTHFVSFVVSRDMFQPDHAVVELANEKDVHSLHKVGDSLKVKVRDTVIFDGEINAIRGLYRGAGGHTGIQLHGLSKMARLHRAKKSTTYQDMTDEDILKKVVSSSGMSLEWKHEAKIKYKHVYQHNQTDLEFLRTRAARLGCHVW